MLQERKKKGKAGGCKGPAAESGENSGIWKSICKKVEFRGVEKTGTVL